MTKDRLDKMEEMLTTLITMVGNINDKQNQMGEKLDRMENRLDKIEKRLDKMEDRLDKMENRLEMVEKKLDKLEDGQKSMREEIMAKLKDMQADQDHIWEKAVRNERELAKLKIHLQL
jgi:chromosome segregation ATPase